jgi:predicted dehydrogenase
VLFDVGPHVLDLAEACAGPIASMTGRRSRNDMLCLVLEHVRGGVSQLTLSFNAAAQAPLRNTYAFDAETHISLPAPTPEEVQAAARTSMAEFAAAVRTGSPILLDADRGALVQRLLAQATEATLGAARTSLQSSPRVRLPLQHFL